MASTRQLASVLVRQRLSAQVFNTCQRSLHTSVVRFNNNNTEKTNFAENLTNKFIGQVKKQGKKSAEPTRFVQIDSLPVTATTEDVRKLAREAFPQGDKRIVEAVFCRSPEFNFQGRCVVLMASPEDARRVVEYGNRRSVGGNTIRMTYSGDSTSNPSTFMSALRRPELTSITDSTSASGRAVVITGLPSRTETEHLLGFLRSRNFFPIEGAPDNVLHLKTKEQSTVSKFLVKFDSESEAWRCVRAFHNTDFLLKNRDEKYKLSLSVVY
ncbi:hypothetical protein INT47_005483 [Mucor saturninus]|uniref:RRM domain-containing protein n=1 Tax=Mucor saturninus TaxID=64648 RepID=A0A8H7RGF8_9FUNG|nr:hypothetical protein INT47_005483 [Mucor saturninus]